MVKDVLNKSHLSEFDECVINKVLNENYKPSKLSTFLTKITVNRERAILTFLLTCIDMIFTELTPKDVGLKINIHIPIDLNLSTNDLIIVTFITNFLINWLVFYAFSKLTVSDLTIKEIFTVLKRL